MIPEIKNMPYHFKLDSIPASRIVNSIDDRSFEKYFTKIQYKYTRGNPLKIKQLPVFPIV